MARFWWLRNGFILADQFVQDSRSCSNRAYTFQSLEQKISLCDELQKDLPSAAR